MASDRGDGVQSSSSEFNYSDPSVNQIQCRKSATKALYSTLKYMNHKAFLELHVQSIIGATERRSLSWSMRYIALFYPRRDDG